MTKTEIRDILDHMMFPDGAGTDKSSYDSLIEGFIHDGADLEVLKDALIDKLMDEQEKIMQQNMKDVMAGKYKDVSDMERSMPLFRKENPDGSAQLLNVPDEFAVWAAFIGTLNEDYLEK